MDKVIEVKNLVKVYGKRSSAFTALRNIDLDIYAGESVAIIGKSGSGKSTLMHLLALLDKPTSGTIKINGVDSTRLGARRLNQLRNQTFGFVFQQFFMNPSDSVLENVMLPLKIAGVRRRQRRDLAAKAIDTVGLAERARFKANDLSGGQKQRVCIARAIVNNPKIIFADEPTGNLDSGTGEKIIDLLFDFNRRKKATLIIVTHDEDLAALCDRQIRIIDGKIVQDTQILSENISLRLDRELSAASEPEPASPLATKVSSPDPLPAPEEDAEEPQTLYSPPPEDYASLPDPNPEANDAALDESATPQPTPPVLDTPDTPILTEEK